MKNNFKNGWIQLGYKVRTVCAETKGKIIDAFKANSESTLAVDPGEGYVDSGVKILIAVVVGSVLLMAILGLMNNDVLPSVQQNISDMFTNATPTP